MKLCQNLRQSGAKKRFKATAKGKIRASAAFLSHNLRKRPQKMKRKALSTMILQDCDAKIVKTIFTLFLDRAI